MENTTNQTTRPAQKIDGSGKVHATTLGRRGGRVLLCSGRTMFDLVPTDRAIDCPTCSKREAR